MPESVEGQNIARDVLAEVAGAWERFQTAYQDRLLSLAARRLHSDRRLRETHQANDLVQAFLHEKVLRHLASMLGPTADGHQPLWPRLSRSFVNFCHSVRQRTPQPPVSLPDPGAVAAPAPPADSGPAAETLASRLGRRAVMFQNAFAEALSGSLPLYHLLLLSERLLLAERVACSLATEDGSLPEGYVGPQPR